MLKNGKYDSKDKSVVFFFDLKKIYHLGGTKHSSISALPDLDRIKKMCCVSARRLSIHKTYNKNNKFAE
jgi:hypothetical protein